MAIGAALSTPFAEMASRKTSQRRPWHRMAQTNGEMVQTKKNARSRNATNSDVIRTMLPFIIDRGRPTHLSSLLHIHISYAFICYFHPFPTTPTDLQHPTAPLTPLPNPPPQGVNRPPFGFPPQHTAENVMVGNSKRNCSGAW